MFIYNEAVGGVPWCTIPLILNQFNANKCIKHKYPKMEGLNYGIRACSRGIHTV
jgi:hypothetical protein